MFAEVEREDFAGEDVADEDGEAAEEEWQGDQKTGECSSDDGTEDKTDTLVRSIQTHY